LPCKVRIPIFAGLSQLLTLFVLASVHQKIEGTPKTLERIIIISIKSILYA